MSPAFSIMAVTLTVMAMSSTAASAAGSLPPWVAHWDPPPAANGGGGGASSAGHSNSQIQAERAVKFACIVGGTPLEFPNDIWMTNTTNATLLKGTALSFLIPSVGVKGTFLLPSNVAAGQQVKIADIFGGAQAGAPCTVRFA